MDSIAKPDPNIGLFLATPAIWLPGMNDGDWEQEVDLMIGRSMATRDFVQNQITPEEFAEALYEGGLDPDQCFEIWEEGISLL